MILKNLYLLIVAGMLCIQAGAQTPGWQWAKSGGSADNTVLSGTGNEEDIYAVTTDPNGNVYALGTLQQTVANVDGHIIPTWGDRDNVVLSSFRCDGTYRWTKVFGNNNGGAQPVTVKTDPLGGIYIALGLDNYDAAHFDTDTTVPYAGHFRQLLLIKYDTAGHLKWFHWPESDTISVWGATSFNPDLFDLCTDPAGNVYMLCSLSPGANVDGAYIVSPGTNAVPVILKYSSSGAFVSAIPIDMKITGYPPMSLKMRRNPNNGRFYITGSLQDIAGGGTLSFGGTLIEHDLFLACFDATGALVWQRQGRSGNPAEIDATFGGIDMDAAGCLYLAGFMRNLDTFNGYVAHNLLSGVSYAVPAIVKVDSNGNNLWAKNAYESDGETWGIAVAVNGDEVATTGVYGGKFTWPGLTDTFGYPINTYLYNVFAARFDAATGAAKSMDTIASGMLQNEYPHAMASDKFGNVYVGGMFAYQMYYSCGDTLTSVGGETDFFLAKYGTANCSTPLVTLGTPESIPELPVSVYPNPAANELIVEHAPAGAALRLFNMMGQLVLTDRVNDPKQTMSISQLPPGSYILRITDEYGNSMSRMIVKQ